MDDDDLLSLIGDRASAHDIAPFAAAPVDAAVAPLDLLFDAPPDTDEQLVSRVDEHTVGGYRRTTNGVGTHYHSNMVLEMSFV